MIEDDEYEDDKYGLVKGHWSTSTRNVAKLLIPVPPPCDGVLAVGDKLITSPKMFVPADSSSNIPADCVSAGHVPADRDRIC
ncbi:hypothetical protein Tco_1013975, partial [Tanacetum coccineum]